MSALLNLHSVSTALACFLRVASHNDCRLSRGGSAGFGEAAAAAPPDQVAQVAQAMAQNPGARGMDLAAKMMEKMGWKSGLGLGRNKQVGVASVANAWVIAVEMCAYADCSRLHIHEVLRQGLQHAENSTYLLCCSICATRVSHVMGMRSRQCMHVSSLIIVQSPVCMWFTAPACEWHMNCFPHALLTHTHHAMCMGAQHLAMCMLNSLICWSTHLNL